MRIWAPRLRGIIVRRDNCILILLDDSNLDFMERGSWSRNHCSQVWSLACSGIFAAMQPCPRAKAVFITHHPFRSVRSIDGTCSVFLPSSPLGCPNWVLWPSLCVADATRYHAKPDLPYITKYSQAVTRISPFCLSKCDGANTWRTSLQACLFSPSTFYSHI